MYARNDVKRFHPNARHALAAARRRFAAWVDARVARWLQRCASSVEATQGLFPGRELGIEHESSGLIRTLG